LLQAVFVALELMDAPVALLKLGRSFGIVFGDRRVQHFPERHRHPLRDCGRATQHFGDFRHEFPLYVVYRRPRGFVPRSCAPIKTPACGTNYRKHPSGSGSRSPELSCFSACATGTFSGPTKTIIWPPRSRCSTAKCCIAIFGTISLR